VSPEDLRTRLAFGAMGLASRTRLRTVGWRSNDRMDPAFRAVSTVIRVPAQVGERIESALERMRERWPAHLFYPVATLHVTVLNIDPYVPATGSIAGSVAAAEAALARHGRFRMTLRGVNVSPWTVFAEVHGADREVAGLRASLRRALPARADAPRRDAPLRRALPLVLSNVVRFTQPVEAELLRALRPLRGRAFGSFEAATIEIVRTDGLLSEENTEPLSTVTLRG